MKKFKPQIKIKKSLQRHKLLKKIKKATTMARKISPSTLLMSLKQHLLKKKRFSSLTLEKK